MKNSTILQAYGLAWQLAIESDAVASKCVGELDRIRRQTGHIPPWTRRASVAVIAESQSYRSRKMRQSQLFEKRLAEVLP